MPPNQIMSQLLVLYGNCPSGSVRFNEYLVPFLSVAVLIMGLNKGFEIQSSNVNYVLILTLVESLCFDYYAL